MTLTIKANFRPIFDNSCSCNDSVCFCARNYCDTFETTVVVMVAADVSNSSAETETVWEQKSVDVIKHNLFSVFAVFYTAAHTHTHTHTH